MRTIGRKLPTFWWLNPWGTVLYLHQAVNALHEMNEVQHRALVILDQTIDALNDYKTMVGDPCIDAGPIPEDCES